MNRFIITLNADAHLSAFLTYLEQNAISVVVSFAEINVLVITAHDDQFQSLTGHPEVMSVEPERMIHVHPIEVPKED